MSLWHFHNVIFLLQRNMFTDERKMSENNNEEYLNEKEHEWERWNEKS